MKLFVTAIGTDCGKTVVSAILCEALKAGYWKPVQTGAEQSDTEEIRRLVSFPLTAFPETHLLKAPVSPHHAATLEGIHISLSDFQMPDTSQSLVIEGAGGLLVPLNGQGDFLLDWIGRQKEIEVVLVIKLYLGCINHALLSMNELKARGMKIKGLVFNGEDSFGAVSVIQTYSKLPVLFHLPEEPCIDPATVWQYGQQLHLHER